MQAAFGIGAYSPAEAGRLVNIPPATLRHWLFGYSYDHHGPKRRQPPLWRAQYDPQEGEPLLGFRDLLEARIVRKLRKAGLALPVIRRCLTLAREIAGDDHPFSTSRFRSDGKTLFLGQEDNMLDLRTRQRVFSRFIEPSFVDLEFGADTALRWWLNSRQTLVIDPERSFGQPIVASSGITTATLAQAAEAEGSALRAARLYEVDVQVVRDAVAFERRTLH